MDSNIFFEAPNAETEKPRLRVDVVLSVLSSEDREELHDEAYATISLIDSSYNPEIDKFAAVIRGRDAASFAKSYALDALIVLVNDRDAFCGLVGPGLEDPDEVLRAETVNAIVRRRCASTDRLLSGLIAIAKGRSDDVMTRCRALSLMVKYIGLKNAVRKLKS